MSYTQLQKEVNKYKRQHKPPTHYNALTTPPEEVQIIKARHRQIELKILETWKADKRYKELISIAHNSWFGDEFFKALGKFLRQINNGMRLFFYTKRSCIGF